MKKEKHLKKIISICIFIIVVQGVFLFYSFFFQSKESIYFDGINAIRKNDNYYFAVGSNNDNDNHYEKAKVSVYDEKRDKLFEKLYNVGFNSAYFGACVEDNGLIAVGSYEKTKKDHNALVRRGLIVRYDYDGSIVFSSEFKLLDNTKFTNVISVEDGYYVIGQSIYKSTDFGNEQGGGILVKYDKKGNVDWYKSLGNSKEGIFNDLYLSDDFIYVVGQLNDNVGVLCKYKLDGELIYQKEFDNNIFNSVYLVDDYLYICGSSDSSALLLKMSLEGDIITSSYYDKVSNAKFNRIIYDDSLIVIGSSFNKNYDGIIVKYGMDLEELSAVTYGDDKNDYLTDIIFDDGNYLVVGYSVYEDKNYLSKFIRYSEALKVLGVEK